LVSLYDPGSKPRNPRHRDYKAAARRRISPAIKSLKPPVCIALGVFPLAAGSLSRCPKQSPLVA